MHDLIVILLAVLAHFIGEFLESNQGYTCPNYCKVDHQHIKEKENVRENGCRCPEGQKRRDCGLHQREGEHPSSKRSERGEDILSNR